MEAKRGAIHSEQAKTGQAKDLSSSGDKGSAFVGTDTKHASTSLPGLAGDAKTPGKLTVEPGTGMSFPHAPANTGEHEVTLATAGEMNPRAMTEEAFEAVQSRLAREADERIKPLLDHAKGYEALVQTIAGLPEASADEILEEESSNYLAQEDPHLAHAVVRTWKNLHGNVEELNALVDQNRQPHEAPETTLFRGISHSLSREKQAPFTFEVAPHDPVTVVDHGTAISMTMSEKDMDRLLAVSPYPYQPGLQGFMYRADLDNMLREETTPVSAERRLTRTVPVILINGAYSDAKRNLAQRHELGHVDLLLQKRALAAINRQSQWAAGGIHESTDIPTEQTLAVWEQDVDAARQSPLYQQLLQANLSMKKEELLIALGVHSRFDSHTNYTGILWGMGIEGQYGIENQFGARQHLKNFPAVCHALNADSNDALGGADLHTLEQMVDQNRKLNIQDRTNLLTQALVGVPVTQWGTFLSENGFRQELREAGKYLMMGRWSKNRDVAESLERKLVENKSAPITMLLNQGNKKL